MAASLSQQEISDLHLEPHVAHLGTTRPDLHVVPEGEGRLTDDIPD